MKEVLYEVHDGKVVLVGRQDLCVVVYLSNLHYLLISFSSEVLITKTINHDPEHVQIVYSIQTIIHIPLVNKYFVF